MGEQLGPPLGVLDIGSVCVAMRVCWIWNTNPYPWFYCVISSYPPSFPVVVHCLLLSLLLSVVTVGSPTFDMLERPGSGV